MEAASICSTRASPVAVVRYASRPTPAAKKARDAPSTRCRLPPSRLTTDSGLASWVSTPVSASNASLLRFSQAMTHMAATAKPATRSSGVMPASANTAAPPTSTGMYPTEYIGSLMANFHSRFFRSSASCGLSLATCCGALKAPAVCSFNGSSLPGASTIDMLPLLPVLPTLFVNPLARLSPLHLATKGLVNWMHPGLFSFGIGALA
mmetsp:Transcript_28883/g.73733  ORF Transcript_28883/g.73733 Transcript_28883/m.73733 type:complete len:207 (+) Transcript_28883:854-1474(+)